MTTLFIFQAKDLYWCIDTSYVLSTSTIETYYSNYIARQLYAQKCLKFTKSQYWRVEELMKKLYRRG